MKVKNYPLIAAVLVILAAVLRFWGISTLEIQHDMALNAVRALGWFDFLVGVGQSSPIVWFGEIPWWANLSFHDHPPGVFLSQHLSFWFFGDNEFAAHLPFALAGVLTAFFIYKFTEKFRSKNEALAALSIFSVSSYAIWAARTGYLEGVQVLFLVLSFFLFLRFNQSLGEKDGFFLAIILGAAVLCKYTSIFILAAEGLFVLLWRRELLRRKSFWLSVLVFLIILSPVAYYNIKVFETRGHFDAALSSMIGMHPQDFAVIAGRSVSVNPGANLLSVFEPIRRSTSLPLFVFFIASLVFLIYRLARREADDFQKLLFLSIFFMVGMFSFAGASERFLSIAIPFLSLSLAIAFGDAVLFLRENRYLKVLPAIIVLVLFLELVFAVNTNFLTKPFGKEGITFAPTKVYAKGFVGVDNFLREQKLVSLSGTSRKIQRVEDLGEFSLKSKEAVVFDDRADWFSVMWYVKRYNFYSDTPILPLSDLIIVASQNQSNPLDDLVASGVERFWYIQTTKAGIGDYNIDENFKISVERIENNLELYPKDAVKEFTNDRGEVTFRVYYFGLE